MELTREPDEPMRPSERPQQPPQPLSNDGRGLLSDDTFLRTLDTVDLSPTHTELLFRMPQVPSPSTVLERAGQPPLPAVPSVEPQTKTERRAKQAPASILSVQQIASSTLTGDRNGKRSKGSDHVAGDTGEKTSTDVRAADEDEEALEELEEVDEVEELAEEDDFSPTSLKDDASAVHTPMRMDSRSLATALRIECVDFQKALLRNMLRTSTSGRAGEMDGSKFEAMLKILDQLSSEIARPSLSAIPSEGKQHQEHANQLQKIVKALSDMLPVPTDEQAAYADDLRLTQALANVLQDFDPEMFVSLPLSMPASPTDASSMEQDSIRTVRRDSGQTSSSSGHRETRSPQAGILRLSMPYTANATATRSSSPSFSREELRNPFATEEDPKQTMDEKLFRDRAMQDDLIRLIGLLDEVNKRFDANIASVAHQGTSGGVQSKSWEPLHQRTASCRAILASRRIDLLNGGLGSPLSSLRRSSSPLPHSPTFNLSSQRNSRAPSPSFTAQQSTTIASNSNDSIAGDPAGEALVAGMGGVGAPRSLSRMSTSSNRGSSVAFLPRPPSSLTRRNSARSDSGQSPPQHRAFYSPPPRYSAESTASWASNVFPPLNGPESEELAIPASTGRQRVRRKSDSSDNTFGTGGAQTYLPAYLKDGSGSPPSASVDQKATSSSSLVALSDTTRVGLTHMSTPSTEEKDLLPTKHHRQMSESLLSSRNMHPAHELQQLQRNIDRLYTAAPQLVDQRAGRPDPSRRASQREDDFARLMETMAKHGRMDDQRAMPPSASSSRSELQLEKVDSNHTNSSKEEVAHKAHARPRRFPSVSHINISSLPAVRRAKQTVREHTHFRNGKGKDRQPAIDDASETVPIETDTLAWQTPSANLARSTDEQKAPALSSIADSARRKLSKFGMNGHYQDNDVVRNSTDSAEAAEPSIPRDTSNSNHLADGDDDLDLLGEAPQRRSKSRGKLARMGVENEPQGADDDDDIFDMIATSGSRMPNQDVVLRKPGTKKLSRSHGADQEQTNSKSLMTASSLGPGPLRTGELRGLAAYKARADISTRDSVSAAVEEDSAGQGNRLGGWAYLAESQDRLGAISVLLWLRDEAHLTQSRQVSYALRRTSGTNKSTFSVFVQTDTSSVTLTYPTPRQAQIPNSDQTPMMFSKTDMLWKARLSIASTKTDPSSTIPPKIPFGAGELSRCRPKVWQCTCCGKPVVDTSRASRYISLPSQHWEELVDAWMCHADQELNDHLVQAQKDLERHAGLDQGQVHVADECIVLSGSMLEREATRLVKKLVVCRQCDATLGCVSEGGAIKMSKFAVRPSESAQAIQVPPLSAFIAHDLIRSAQAHAARRFVLVASDKENSSSASTARPVYVWLFLDLFHVTISPAAAMIQTLASASGDANLALPDSDAITLAACKVLYRIGHDASGDEDSSSSARPEHWTSATAVERLYYPADVCKRIESVLEASNACYPPKQRIFMQGQQADKDIWRVAFLPFHL